MKRLLPLILLAGCADSTQPGAGSPDLSASPPVKYGIELDIFNVGALNRVLQGSSYSFSDGGASASGGHQLMLHIHPEGGIPGTGGYELRVNTAPGASVEMRLLEDGNQYRALNVYESGGVPVIEAAGTGFLPDVGDESPAKNEGNGVSAGTWTAANAILKGTGLAFESDFYQHNTTPVISLTDPSPADAGVKWTVTWHTTYFTFQTVTSAGAAYLMAVEKFKSDASADGAALPGVTVTISGVRADGTLFIMDKLGLNFDTD